jgi:hypothetical protein
MEEAADLGNYLPLSFKSPKEQEYIEFLWDAFEKNYMHRKVRMGSMSFLNTFCKISGVIFFEKECPLLRLYSFCLPPFE